MRKKMPPKNKRDPNNPKIAPAAAALAGAAIMACPPDQSEDNQAGEQLAVQKKMADITQLLGQRLKHEEDNVTNVYAKEVAINGLCGGWTVLFIKYPDWVEPIYNAVRSWVCSTGVLDEKALVEFEEHLAKTTDVSSKDKRGVSHVVKLLRDAYEEMNELEPDAGYTNLPVWTNIYVERYLWINPKLKTSDMSQKFSVTNLTAGQKVACYLSKLSQAQKVVECMAHIESDQHHMAIRVKKEKNVAIITVVETELMGMKKVDNWSQAQEILNNWLVNEKELSSIKVKTKILNK
jgi:hypothetical protein